MTLSQVFQLSVPDARDVDFRIEAIRGREAIHAPFSFEVKCAPLDSKDHTELAAADPLSWIGAEATLAWEAKGGAERKLKGVIEEVASSPPSCVFKLSPHLAADMDEKDYRVFVNKSAIEVAQAVLGEHSIKVVVRTKGPPPPRAQRIQVFEGDLAFVARLLADEGIAYYLSADGASVILADDEAGYDDLDLSLSFIEEGGLEADEAVFAARLSRRAVVEEVALRDYDFERPMLDLTARSGDGSRGLTRMEYPAGHRDPAAVRALAAARLTELRGRRLVLTGETGSRALRPGGILSMSSGARDEMNGRFLVTEVEHEGKEREAGARTYVARFRAVPLAGGFRPPRARAPRSGGVDTARVTGPRGAEIHTEGHGRVRVSHKWDHRSPGDDKSSAWARTAQPATSGSIFMPRVGWEVLVGFSGDGGDDPVVLGRLDHGKAPPPEGLPGGRVKSALGTQTTPGGGSLNRIATDDTAGAEAMAFVASKDFNERTENDKVTAIKASDSWNIGATSSLRVGTVLQQAVAGAQTYVVGGFRSVGVGANLTCTASSEVVLIGGMRLLTAGGDHSTKCAVFTRIVAAVEVELPIEHQTRFVEGASVVVNAGGWLTSAGRSAGVAVGGASGLHVGGPMVIDASEHDLSVKGFLWEKYASRSVTAGGGYAEVFRGSGTYDIKSTASFTGSEVLVEAKTKLTIKAGGVTVEMTPSKITVTGQFKGQCDSVQGSDSKFG